MVWHSWLFGGFYYIVRRCPYSGLIKKFLVDGNAEIPCNGAEIVVRYGLEDFPGGMKRNFKTDKPFSKCVTDITEIKAKNGNLYVSAIVDCYDLTAVGLSMDDNMRAELCAATVENTAAAYPEFRGAVLHSDRGSQYTSASYRAMLNEYGVKQSMNSAGGRCHDNDRCESIRGLVTRMKNELFYSRGRRSTDYTTEKLKTMIWRYYMSYWNNRRICSPIVGMPPAEKRRRYYSDKTGKSAAAME